MSVTVNDSARLRKQLAQMPQVHAAVLAARDVVAAKAEVLFATHDHPGGHSISTSDGDIDAYVNLDGPAPLSVEFGRHPDDHGKDGMRGLHILGQAAGL